MPGSHYIPIDLPLIIEATNEFYRDVYADATLGPIFKNLNMLVLRRHISYFIYQLTAFDTPMTELQIEHLRKVHAPIIAERNVNQHHFDMLMSMLISSLRSFGAEGYQLLRVQSKLRPFREVFPPATGSSVDGTCLVQDQHLHNSRRSSSSNSGSHSRSRKSIEQSRQLQVQEQHKRHTQQQKEHQQQQAEALRKVVQQSKHQPPPLPKKEQEHSNPAVVLQQQCTVQQEHRLPSTAAVQRDSVQQQQPCKVHCSDAAAGRTGDQLPLQDNSHKHHKGSAAKVKMQHDTSKGQTAVPWWKCLLWCQ